MTGHATQLPERHARRAAVVALAISVLLIAMAGEALADTAPAPPAPASASAATVLGTAPSPLPDPGTAGTGPIPDPTPAPAPNPHLPAPGTPGNGGPPVNTRLPAPAPIPPANPPGAGPNWWDIPGQIEQAIDTWLGDLAQAALTPVLTLFGAALLATPDVTQGRVAELWQANLVLADSLYVLLVVIGGILVMGHETVQTRYGIKQIAPRMVFGFLAANLSLQIIGQLNSAVAALAAAIWGQPLNAAGIGNRLLQTILAAAIMPDGATQIFLIILALVICALAVAVLLSCALRTAGLMVLAALAPLPLATHALPGLDGAARLWWRCLGAIFAIQVLQTLTFVLMLQVIFDPGGATLGLFPTSSGLTDLLVCAALMLILLKIPGWALRVALGHTPRTFVGGVLRTASAAAIGAAIGVPGFGGARYLIGRAGGQAVGGYLRHRTARPSTASTAASHATKRSSTPRTLQPLGGTLPHGSARGSHRSGQMALFPMPRGIKAPEPGTAQGSARSAEPVTPTPTSGPGWRQPPLFTIPSPLTGGTQDPLFPTPPRHKAEAGARRAPEPPAPSPPLPTPARGVQRGLFPRELGRQATLADQMKVRRSRRRVGDSLHVKFLPPPSPPQGDDT